MSVEPATGRPPRAATHPARPPFGWWFRRQGYILYLLREFSSVAIAVWAVVFLVQIGRAKAGAAGYAPFGGPAWIAFSAVCLAFALWHAYTFLGLAGEIMRIPLGQRTVPSGLIRMLAFGGLAVISAAILFLFIWGGR